MDRRPLPEPRVVAVCGLLTLALSGCGAGGAGTVDSGGMPIPFCEGSTTARYDPLHPSELVAFPDDAYTDPDPDAPTGIRVRLDAENAPWTTFLAAPLQPILSELGERSGFGRLGGVVLRFSGPVQGWPTDVEGSLVGPAIQWWDLSVTPPARVPFEVQVGETGDQLVLEPLRTLRAGARHAVLVTTALHDAVGGCVSPAPLTRARLEGRSPDPALDARVAEAVHAAGLEPGDVSQVLVYTTHDDLGPMVAAAEHVRTANPAWTDGPTCTDGAPVVCAGAFVAQDYRTSGAVEGGEPQGTWTLQPVVWLPADADGPVPVVVFGHGLNGRGRNGGWLASLLPELGVAVVGLDALHHGVHPTADPEDDLPALAFLGIDLAGLQLDARGLRGSFDQSVLDRLQLLQLLRAQPDLDGDGEADIDPDRLLYFGVSLGGLMGPALMALEPDVGAGVLAVGGGKLSTFATEGEVVSTLGPVLEALVGPPDTFARLLPVFQAAVDPSDPAVWAAHVLGERLDDAAAPDLLLPVAEVDDTVPPASAKALARGLGLPHLAPVADPVPGLEEVDGPLAANGPDGSTIAYFQLDRVTAGSVQTATHGNVPGSDEVRWMTLGLFGGHLSDGAFLDDPYAALGTPVVD